jgi:hypothetical protein
MTLPARSCRIQYMHEAYHDLTEETVGVDTWLDNLETVLTAIGQRRLTDDQLDRLARLLSEAEQGAIARARQPRRVR